MRLVLLSSVSAIGLLGLVGPVNAGAEMTGVGQLFIGGGTSDGFAADEGMGDPFIYGGKAKGYWPLSSDVQLQVDLFAEQTDDVMSDVFDETDSTTWGAAVHLLHPFEKRARLGVAGSLFSTEVAGFTGDTENDNTYGLVALEGQFFGTDWTVTGQGGIFTAIACADEACRGLEDGTFVRGKVRYFLNDNTALGLETTQMWGNIDDEIFDGKSFSVNSSLWSLEAEHKFRDSQFSGFVAVTHERTDISGVLTFGANTNTAMLGVKWYLDQPTLRSNDQTGAELDTPLFGNAFETAGGIAGILD